MMIDYESMRKQYESRETDDLITLHKSGTLTDEAYEVLESVLKNRETAIPNRPNEKSLITQNETKKPLPLWLRIIMSIVSLGILGNIYIKLVMPLTGSGTLSWGLAVVLPWFIILTFLFPPKSRRKSTYRSTNNEHGNRP